LLQFYIYNKAIIFFVDEEILTKAATLLVAEGVVPNIEVTVGYRFIYAFIDIV